jgi:hypothetical protein
LFGLVVTLGLFSYEIYGIRKCHALINAGKVSRCPSVPAGAVTACGAAAWPM